MNEELYGLLGLDPEKIRQQQQMQGLLAAGLNVLAASGPSTTPRSLGQIVAQGGMAGLQAYEQAGEQAVQGGVQKLKIEEIKKKFDEQGKIRQAMSLPTVKEQVDALQKMGRYDLVKDIAESQQSLRKAGLIEPTPGAELENPFLPYTKSQSPQVKQLADTYFKGFQAGRIDADRADKVIETLGKMEADFARGVDAREDRRLARDLAQMAREEKRMEGTEGQKLSAGFASRMEAANAILDQLEEQGGALPTEKTEALGAIPFLGGYARRKAMSSDQQRYRQAAQNWIRANLRKESGAAIGDAEMEAEYETYFPVPGDTKEAIEQKREARKITTDAMIKNAGPVYSPTTGARVPTRKPKDIKNQYGLE